MEVYLIGVGIAIVTCIICIILNLKVNKQDIIVEDLISLGIVSLFSYIGAVFMIIALIFDYGQRFSRITVFKAKR
jgi:hypothetical protein